MTAYAELQATSNFSFLRGASHPHELVQAAAEQGLAAIALTDRNSLAGVVRAHQAARQLGIRFVLGVRLDLREKVASPAPREASEPRAAERGGSGPARTRTGSRCGCARSRRRSDRSSVRPGRARS